jgi:SAM-dependent methyltransferase
MQPDFARFDRRHYPTVPVRAGYEAWAPTYEETVDDLMDVQLLERVATVDWGGALTRVADLGCGSGRTGAWLRTRGEFSIDGVDATPAMIERARARGIYERLAEADVRHTGLDAAAYDLVTSVLVDEHLPELAPLYAEARRLLGSSGAFILIGVHPYFLMAVGMPTHFETPSGGPVAIETHLHLPSEHVAAAASAGFCGSELHEAWVDDRLLERKPSWADFRDLPFSHAWVWSVG